LWFGARTGLATDVEEFSENLCCVASQIADKTGKVEGAIGISTTAKHFCKEADALVDLVRKAAQDASLLLD
jgi:DNA-binding IclR family transcriptional regulator